MAKTDFKTIDDYQSTFPEEIQERMQIIRNIVHRIVPTVEEAISYQIPCFKYKGYLLYYSAYAKHISLSHPFSDALLENFKENLKNYKVSKSAIQIPNNVPLPLQFIEDFVKFRAEENENKPEKK
jgi:uncharacterized protein YdhG (YjbR/CyaY superfamily)